MAVQTPAKVDLRRALVDKALQMTDHGVQPLPVASLNGMTKIRMHLGLDSALHTTFLQSKDAHQLHNPRHRLQGWPAEDIGLHLLQEHPSHHKHHHHHYHPTWPCQLDLGPLLEVQRAPKLLRRLLRDGVKDHLPGLTLVLQDQAHSLLKHRLYKEGVSSEPWREHSGWRQPTPETKTTFPR